MNRFLKTIMIWLLLAALPVQAIASATMISCGPSHKASAAGLLSMAAEHQAVLGAAPHSVPAASTGHEAHAHDSDGADSADSAKGGHKHATSSCSACGVCSVGAALLPPTPDWNVGHGGAESALTLPEFAILSHISTGLERPPRFLSA